MSLVDTVLGPGLAIRVLGAVSEDKLEILRGADKIFIDEIREAGLYDNGKLLLFYLFAQSA